MVVDAGQRTGMKLVLTAPGLQYLLSSRSCYSCQILLQKRIFLKKVKRTCFDYQGLRGLEQLLLLLVGRRRLRKLEPKHDFEAFLWEFSRVDYSADADAGSLTFPCKSVRWIVGESLIW